MNPNDQTYQALKRWQKALNLTDSDTELLNPPPVQQSLSRHNPKDLAFFRKKLQDAMERTPLQENELLELQALQQVLHLTNEEVVEIEQQLAKTVLQPNPATLGTSTIFTKSPNPEADAPLKASTEAAHPSSPDESIAEPIAAEPIAKLSGNKESVLKRRVEIDGAGNTASAAQLNHPVSHPVTSESEKPPVDKMTADKTGPDASLHLTQPPVSPTEATTATTTVDSGLAATTVTPPTTTIQAGTSPPTATPPVVPVSINSATPVSKERRSNPWGLLLLLLLGLGAIAAAWWFLKYQPTAQIPPADPQKAQQQAQNYLQAGNQKVQEGQLDAAVKEYTQAIAADPKNPISYVNRGLAHENTGDRGKALDDYNKAIELNDKLAEAYSNRSHVHFDQQKYDEAIKDAEKAIELKPSIPEAYLNLGNAWFAKNDLDKAAQNYDKAIQLNPVKAHLARAYNGMGNVSMAKIPVDRNELDDTAKKNLDEGLKNYDQAVQLDSKYADGIYNRALAFERKRDLPSAIRDFKDAAKLYQEQKNNDLSRRSTRRADQLEKNLPSPSPTPQPSPQQTMI